ncbi:hypothetical protein [Halapricum salinum]|uniref:Uncharacterized protein n=1 Tax=Halapricum salinum TaxID=1457250 RepID=A0A4D6HDS4_9EURY|nr:hypothetical protein [Halapricum salinum]QCC52113.1 hypothetical protein DV733_13140 [Halapricum salinum]
MSMAIAHFAMGSACTILVVAVLLPSVPYPRVLGLLGGGWAMIPDFHWISPVFAAELKLFHGSALANVFWFHNALDVADTTDSKAVAAGALALLAVATAVAEHRSYRALEPIRAYARGDDE